MTVRGFIQLKACVIFKMVYVEKKVVWKMIMEKTAWRDIEDVRRLENIQKNIEASLSLIDAEWSRGVGES